VDQEPDPISERIRTFRRSLVGCETQAAFAQALGIDQQRLSGYENGTRVPHHVIAGMVRLGVNPYWLLFGEGEMRGGPTSTEALREMSIRILNVTTANPSERQIAELYALPLYADERAAALPQERRDIVIEGPAIIHRAWCPHPRQTDYVRVRSTGASMEPTVPAGAIVTIDRSLTTPEADHLVGKVVAIALIEGGVLLRRLRRTERGGYVGVPDNPSSENRAVQLSAEDRILGLVQTVHAHIG